MNLEYVKNEVAGNRITIWVKSAKKEVICPYCGKPSKKGHWLWNWNIQRYSFVESIINLVNEFKQMLKSKNVENLEEWIEKASNLKIRKIDKFVNGLKRDMHAVRNAIIYECNDRLAEDSVNKLKVIKRIMYGRNKFEMLRQKVLLLENNG